MNRAARAKLASETLEILDKGKYFAPGGTEVDLSESIRSCVAGTRQFGPDQLCCIRDKVLSRQGSSLDTSVELANETTLAGAFNLCRASSDGRAGVLNFASAMNPGGGFLGGSQAQEESLARSSGLYKSLLECPDYYSFHRTSRCQLYSHRAIYSPGCPVFRNDAGDLLSVPYSVDVFSSSAPNAGAVRRNQPEKAEEILTVLCDRVTLILGLALHLHATDLVLGAWGCGVFQNEPASVAEAFRDALREDGPFSGRFRTVRFSVLDRSCEGSTYQAFADAFGARGQQPAGPNARGRTAQP